MPDTAAKDAPKGLMDEDGRVKSTIVLDEAEAPGTSMSWSMLGPIGPAMVVIAASLIAVFTIPGLEQYRP